MLRDLERLARAIEVGSVRMLRSGDPVTDSWIRERAAAAAVAVRVVKRSVAIPGSGTRETFRDRLVTDLKLIACGDWEGLERCNQPTAAVRGADGAAFRTVARTLGIAFLPTAGAVAYHRVGPGTPLPPWVAAGCAVWAVYNLLLFPDPMLADRTDAFRSLLGLLRGKGKGRD